MSKQTQKTEEPKRPEAAETEVQLMQDAKPVMLGLCVVFAVFIAVGWAWTVYTNEKRTDLILDLAAARSNVARLTLELERQKVDALQWTNQP